VSTRGESNATRTHLSLNKDASLPRSVEWAGNIVCRPIFGASTLVFKDRTERQALPDRT
jgi:hypothetical protein